MAHLEVETVRDLMKAAPAGKPALGVNGKPITFPELQYSPAHRTYFVGKPGAVFRGYPSVTKAEGDTMIAAEREAEQDMARDEVGEIEAAAPATPVLANAPAVEAKAVTPEVQVDVGAGAADPQIKVGAA